VTRTGLASLLVLLAAGPAGAASYTLESFLARVVEQAPQVEAVANTTESWRAKLGEAQRNWAPTGYMGVDLRNVPNIKCADVNGYVNPDAGARGAGCVRTNTVDLLRSYDRPQDAQPFGGIGISINLSLIQPFYTFGKLESGIGAARAQSERFKAEIEGARADARHRATEAWWKLKWAKAALPVAEYDVGYYAQWVAGIEESIAKGEKKFSEKEQMYSRLFLLGAKQRLDQLRKDLAMAQVQVRLLSHDPEATTDDSELELEPFEEQTLDYYESAMRRLRSESQQIAHGMEASRLWTRYRLTEMLPDIGMVSGFGYANATATNDPATLNGGPRYVGGPFGYLAFGLRAPLDFANRIAIYRVAQAEHRSNLARREYWMGGLGLEVEKALLDVKETRAREQRTGHAEKVARGWLVANDLNWRTLRTDRRELVEVTRAYADWRMQHLRAVYDANMSLSWLKRATGLANLVAPPK
jgi:outer membrane protein TolC